MVGRASTVAVLGLQPIPVVVEAHIGAGLPGFSVIGSSGAAASQASHRVRTALNAVGMTLSSRKFLVSLAPADVPKAGARFDLAMAAALLVEEDKVPAQALARCVLLGELALDGSVRPVTGVLPAAASLAKSDRRLFVADANAAEAALVEGLEVVPIAALDELIHVLRGDQEPRPVPAAVTSPRPPCVDLADVRGQAEARRALEIAAAGAHHLLLLGPPGCGKSMLAHRLVGILPPLTRDEALELAAIRSVAGLLPETGGLDYCPPLRAPHHSMSAASLLGGGSGVARPGELSLAHRGCLFLDELFEWPRPLLESLREPLEEGVIRLARTRATVTYPALVQIVAAANTLFE
jgi:magnesium chelatase family protein